MFFVDSHCHLDFKKFVKPDREYDVNQIIKRAGESRVKYLLVVGTELQDILEIRKISDDYKNIFRSVGIHPNEAKRHLEQFSKDEIAQIILNETKLEKTIAIGEIGLDYYYGYDQKKEQMELFNFELEIAVEANLPVSIHSREAEEDVIETLKKYNIKGTIHCFSGSKKYAYEALDLGFFISVSGIATFKKSIELQEIIKTIPKDRLLIETDSPFLAPVPYRGKVNEPAFIVYTAQKLADLLDTNIEEVADFSSQNFFSLFGKAKK